MRVRARTHLCVFVYVCVCVCLHAKTVRIYEKLSLQVHGCVCVYVVSGLWTNDTCYHRNSCQKLCR